MTLYGEDIRKLRKAIDLCNETGCVSAIPHIEERIRFMEYYDYELNS